MPTLTRIKNTAKDALKEEVKCKMQVKSAQGCIFFKYINLQCKTSLIPYISLDVAIEIKIGNKSSDL